MVNPPLFDTVDQLKQSKWLANVKNQFYNDKYPSECVRCELKKSSNMYSDACNVDKLYKKINPEYIILTGAADNQCNAACISCGPDCSSRIASLRGIRLQVDHWHFMNALDLTNIIQVDLAGGEPAISKKYQLFLKELPDTVYHIRINTNGSILFPNLDVFLKKFKKITITLSIDGIGSVFEYTRWPIKWATFESVLQQYLALQQTHKNLTINTFSTVSALNVNDLPNIINYTKQLNVPHSWSFLERPLAINVKFQNQLTARAKHLFPEIVAIDANNQLELDSFIHEQDNLRHINSSNFI